MLIALVLRLQELGFGLPAMLDPDEPIFVLLGLRLLKNHTLNPAWFGHPATTTIYCLAIIEAGTYVTGHALGWFPNVGAFGKAIYTDPSVVLLPARAFMVVCGIATIALTYLLGRRLFGPSVAIIAAAALALNAVHIRYSQIVRTDMQATVFLLLTILAAIAIVRRGALRDYIWGGVAVGLAVATKWPAAASAVAVLGAAVLRGIEHPEERGLTVRNLFLFAITSVVALLAISPYLLLDFATVRENLQGEERPIHLGATGHGFLGNLVWYAKGPLLTGFGPLGLVGVAVGLVAGVRQSRRFLAVLVPVAGAFLFMISSQALVWERWVVPLLPLAAIALAVGCDMVLTRIRALPRAMGWALASVALALLVVPMILADRDFARERATDTRTLAARWAIGHIPAGSIVTVEHMAFDLLQQPWQFLYPAGDAGCVDVRAHLSGQVSYRQIGNWRGKRAVVDIGTMPIPQLAGCRGDWAILVNWDRYRAEAFRFPDEAANYDRFAASGTVVRSFYPKPGQVGGPTVRIVRFDVKPSGETPAAPKRDRP